MSRFNLDPEECLFIDDNLRNVKAAELLNIPSIQFKSPEQLEKELKNDLLYDTYHLPQSALSQI